MIDSLGGKAASIKNRNDINNFHSGRISNRQMKDDISQLRDEIRTIKEDNKKDLKKQDVINSELKNDNEKLKANNRNFLNQIRSEIANKNMIITTINKNNRILKEHFSKKKKVRSTSSSSSSDPPTKKRKLAEKEVMPELINIDLLPNKGYVNRLRHVAYNCKDVLKAGKESLIGKRVQGYYEGLYFQGTVVYINPEGKYLVIFDDNDEEVYELKNLVKMLIN